MTPAFQLNLLTSIVEFAELQMLPTHLADNAVDVLGPSTDFSLDISCCSSCLSWASTSSMYCSRSTRRSSSRRSDFLVQLRLQVAQRKVFQFPFDLPYTKVGKQREDT